MDEREAALGSLPAAPVMLSRLFRGGGAAPTSPPGPAVDPPPIAELNDLADSANENRHRRSAISVGGVRSGRDDRSSSAKQSTAMQKSAPARCKAVSDTYQGADPPDRARQQNGEVMDSEGLTFSSDDSGAAGLSGAEAAELCGKAESPSASAVHAGVFDSSAAQVGLPSTLLHFPGTGNVTGAPWQQRMPCEYRHSVHLHAKMLS